MHMRMSRMATSSWSEKCPAYFFVGETLEEGFFNLALEYLTVVGVF